MGILAWIVFGGIAGWLASLIAGNSKEQGVVGNIIVGVLGAIVGGWVAGLLFASPGVTGFNFTSFAVAILGAVTLLIIKRSLSSSNK